MTSSTRRWIELDETTNDLLQPTLEDLEQLCVIVSTWDLEIHQATPDLPALRTFLERRYHYFEDDVEHHSFWAEQHDALGGG